MTTFLDRIKSLFRVSDRRKNAGSQRFESRPDRDNDEDDPCDALSEVAAPEPVRRLTPEELSRHPSLEQQLSKISHSGHNSEGDIYEALSELAAPEPIERVSASEIARRPSLEQSLSRASH